MESFVHYTPKKHIPNHEGWELMNLWENSLESDKGGKPVHLSSVCDILELKQHRLAVLVDVLCDFCPRQRCTTQMCLPPCSWLTLLVL